MEEITTRRGIGIGGETYAETSGQSRGRRDRAPQRGTASSAGDDNSAASSFISLHDRQTPESAAWYERRACCFIYMRIMAAHRHCTVGLNKSAVARQAMRLNNIYLMYVQHCLHQ